MLNEPSTIPAPENSYHWPEPLSATDDKQAGMFMEPTYKILMADEHPLFREAISSVLASAVDGSEVLQNDDLESALQVTQENDDIDLILLDLNMPGMNGLNGLMTLRNEVPTIPVVIVSAEEDKQIVLQAITY
ncbi:MAG: response regulator transcription factor, partial [Alteromonadaceae bacterium]|nr:response regulator transcription factor [Alteromonadaceae bacterium]